MKCRFCDNLLDHTLVDLCNSPLANDYLDISQLSEGEVFYPLKLFVCDKCFLVQVDQFRRSDQIFNSQYAYYSSYSKSWVEHARKYVHMMVERFGFNEQSYVVEIASNDGYLLQHFQQLNVPVLGVEPSQNVASAASLKGIPTIVEYFGSEFAARLAGKKKKANLLIGNNVVAHVPDINDFVEGLKRMLRKNGVITLEFPHILEMIKHCEFDTIYHEHFSYLSFYTISRIFEAHDLKIFDVERISTHGGSLRIFAAHMKDESKPITDNVHKLAKLEHEVGIDDINFYKDFQARVDKIRTEFLSFLLEQKKNNKKVIAYGAAAKGNTFLNYAGIKGNDLIQFVVDASEHKVNKFLPGSHIPIVEEAQIKEYRPDYILILPWNIKQEIMEQLSYISEWEGKFITFIPEKKIYDLSYQP